MRFAFVNDNIIMKIEDHEDESTISDRHLFQIVIDITGFDPEPLVGWTWDGLVLYNKLDPLTPRQIRQALVISGIMLSDIDTALGTLPEPMKSLAIISWEYAVQFERRDPLVSNVGLMLGWNSTQLDDLWMLGASL